MNFSFAFLLESDYTPDILLLGVFFMDKKKILLFGGTFNPIHNGHLIVIRDMAEKLGMDKVCLIPNGVPPHKKTKVSPHHKYEMIKLAIQYESLFDITTYEIDKHTPAYTIETVRHFKDALGDSIDKPYLAIGPDTVSQIKTWYKIDELIKECIFVAGISSMTTFVFQEIQEIQVAKNILIKTVIIPHLDIRATDIRERVSKGLSIRHLVPDAVADYIKINGIYRT